MALVFPPSPLNGEIFISPDGIAWEWDGTKWKASPPASGFLPLAGGNMNGPIIVESPPTQLGEAISKGYADSAFRSNRIINGDMRISQRWGTAGGTSQAYTVDRWGYVNSTAPTGRGTWAQVAATAPLIALGFGYALSFISSSAYAAAAGDSFQFYQIIEADMVSDFAWGTANAQPITLSFLFNSSLTGTFSGAIKNMAANRSCPFSFNYSTATQWQKIVITIPGDTAGTWVMSGNAGAVVLNFDLGSGLNYRGPAGAWASTNYNGVTGAQSIVAANSAAFYLTGVKLEIGSVATPFNRQSLTKSLADCQRYYQIGQMYNVNNCLASQAVVNSAMLITSMRAAPTVTIASNSSGNLTTPTMTGTINMAYASATSSAAGTYAMNISYNASAEL